VSLKNTALEIPEKYRYLENDPQARYAIREAFYKNFGRDTNILRWLWRMILWIITGGEGEGRSELDFLKWEIKRGVLNPLDNELKNGSPWWRDVNLDFIILSETAGDIILKKQNPIHKNNEIMHWLNYIKDRRGKSWYRAHNASIVRGYLNRIEEAKNEPLFEQMFMNEVLYRLLFAQSMEEDSSIFQKIGGIMANPMFRSVSIIVSIPAFYPDDYPLSKQDILNILHKGHGLEAKLEDLLDEKLIFPHLDTLYQEAAGWLNIPELTKFVKNGKPLYPHI